MNYHHLYHFWAVAREGSVTRACELLQVSQPTVSTQLKELERSLGAALFTRSGRHLVLTETGRTVRRYADEIFSLGHELRRAVRGEEAGRLAPFQVGVVDVLPKLIAQRMLEPAWTVPGSVRLVCVEGTAEELFAKLATHELDVVLSDAPPPPGVRVNVYSHLLSESDVSIFGHLRFARRYRKGFPACLDGAPFLLPLGTTLRRDLDRWFERNRVRPHVRGEYSDSALMKVAGSHGLGLFAAPTVVAAEVCRQYRVRVVGEVHEVRESYYVVSVERRLKHPCAVAIALAARGDSVVR